jgi:chemotaxis protein histidine kinase CheA
VITDWKAFLSEPAEEPVVEPQPEPPDPQPEPAAPAVDLVAQAQADAIRTRSYAEAEEQRIRAEAEAKAIEIKAAEEARKLKLANDKAEARAAEEQAARNARIAEAERKRAAAERAQQDDEKAHQEQQQSAAVAEEEIAKAADTWRGYAIAFYAVCAIVALPVQIAAFWDRDAPWLVIAPLMLEGAALVVTKGAAAAVAAHRPHWHYRLVAWLFAFVAAGINLKHGLDAFDPATAFGTAFASLAGPGVWDLHEHGRIRKRDGVLTRRERKAAEKAARAEVKRKAADEAARTAEKDAAAAAAAEAALMLAGARAEEFPEVWAEAEKIAAAVGEVDVTEAVWARAYRNIQGCDPGESIESITARRKAEGRVESALSGTPVATLSKRKNAQRAIQVKAPGARSSYRPIPPRRKPNDTPKFHPVARALAADAKRQSNTSTGEQK